MRKVNVEEIIKVSSSKLYEVGTMEYIPYIDFLDEWIKYTSIINENDDIETIKRINRMNYIFKKYKEKKCDNIEYIEAQNYMKISVTEFFSRRLSYYDIEYINSFVASIEEQEPELIGKYIFDTVARYDELMPVEAYVLRILISNYIEKRNIKTNDKIINDNKEDYIKLKKSIIRHYGI